MADRGLTLRDVFFTDGDAGYARRWSELEGGAKLTELKSKLASAATVVPWRHASDSMLRQVEPLLDIGLLDGVLLKIWNEGKLFRKYLDPEKYAAQDAVDVALAKHTIKSEHHPRLEILLDGDPIATIDFEITVEIDVKGAVVEVKNGRIWKISAGELQCEGELACEGVTLAKAKSKKIPVEWEKKFPEGIPIAP